MPLKTAKVFISFLFIIIISTFVFAQTEPATTTLAELKSGNADTPTSAEIMRNRISKAKAYLVVKNYGLAIYELENIRRETNDQTVHRVLNVLLMHAYLEQGDYVKAQKFLKELHSSKNSDAAMDYLAVAGQVVSGAKTLNERYKSLGLSVSDRNLPTEATADVENMRNTLELVVEQSKTLSKNKQYSANAYALLEESSSARSNLAKDVYDEQRWKNEVADAREQIVNPNSRIINATKNPPINSPNSNIVATSDILEPDDDSDEIIDATEKEKTSFNPVKKETTPPKEQPKTNNPAKNTTDNLKPSDDTVAKKEPGEIVVPKDRKVKIITSAEKEEKDNTENSENKNQPNVKSTIEEPKETKKPNENNVAKKEEDKPTDNSPLDVGSLLDYATKRVNPVYPSQAKSMRTTGVVTVAVVIDEDGRVATVENAEGPALLKRAASDAVKKWQFKPFMRDGQPVKATGFISFNFNL